MGGGELLKQHALEFIMYVKNSNYVYSVHFMYTVNGVIF